MTLLKPAEVSAFIARPDPARAIVLVFGPDAGLVSERVEAIVAASIDDPRDSFAVTRMSGDDLAADPAKLVDEAQAIPMFGGRRAIWIRAGGKSFIAALELLVVSGAKETRVVIEAGDLKKSALLRTFCERDKAIAAIACYVDGVKEIGQLVDEEMRAAGLKIAPDARTTLVELLGGDRRASRNELRKLCAFAQGRDGVTLDDVLAVVSDASALALDDIVDAAFAGRPADVETQFSRALSSGTSVGGIVGAALRHAAQLHKWSLEVESGAPPGDVIGSRIFFRRKPVVEAALRTWSAPRLRTAMLDLAAAARDIRVNVGAAAEADEALTRAALLRIAVQARTKAAA